MPRLRQREQSAVGLERRRPEPARVEQLVEGAPRVLALDLDARLPMDALERLGTCVREGRDERQREAGQAAPRRDRARLQRLALARRDARDQREVVVVAPAGRALLVPAADVAVLDRLRVRRGRRIDGRGAGDRVLEPAPA